MASLCACMAPPAALARRQQATRRAGHHLLLQPLLRPAKSLWPSQLQQQRRRRSSVLLAAIMLPLASLTVQQAGQVAWPALLSSAGVFILCCAAAALLLAAIPLLWSLARAANRMESMLQTLEAELPDTAASMRLSSLELSDCLTELGGLGADVSGGLRAAARGLSATEAGLRQGGAALRHGLLPALARRESKARDVLEAALKARAALAPLVPQARAAVNATTTNVRRVRGAMLAARVAAGLYDLGRAMRLRMQATALQQLIVSRELAAEAAEEGRQLAQQRQAQRQAQRSVA